MENGSWSAEFVNCDPSEKVKNDVLRVSEQIDADAPSDSSTKITIEHSDGYFHGHCKVYSIAGVFLSDVSAKTPDRVLERMQKEMKRQMVAWKKDRFPEEPFDKAG